MKELNVDFACNYEIEIATVNGRDVYYTELRIPMAEVPEGFYRYEVRSSDDGSRWSTIENLVAVNHCATILTDEPFELKPHIWSNPFTGDDGVDYYLDIEDYELDDDDDEEIDYDEEMTIWDDDYSDEALEGYSIITWPDSQYVMGFPNYRAHSYLINDFEGLETFGPSAYVVEDEWLSKYW